MSARTSGPWGPCCPCCPCCPSKALSGLWLLALAAKGYFSLSNACGWKRPGTFCISLQREARRCVPLALLPPPRKPTFSTQDAHGAITAHSKSLPFLQDWLRRHAPALYGSCRYTCIEISPTLAQRQLARVALEGGHVACFDGKPLACAALPRRYSGTPSYYKWRAINEHLTGHGAALLLATVALWLPGDSKGEVDFWGS